MPRRKKQAKKFTTVSAAVETWARVRRYGSADTVLNVAGELLDALAGNPAIDAKVAELLDSPTVYHALRRARLLALCEVHHTSVRQEGRRHEDE